MGKLIKDRKVIEDTWQTLFLAEGESVDSAAVPEGTVMVPLAVWLAQREELTQRQEPVGVWLGPADDPETIADDLGRFSLIGIHFPVFRDGRGYSTATLLRTRYGYLGELRAFGDILRDQMQYLYRVGFNSFHLRDDQSETNALKGLDDFSISYQGASREPLPLFRRRSEAEA